MPRGRRVLGARGGTAQRGEPSAWDCHDDVNNRAPYAEVRLPPAALLELLGVPHISKTMPRTTSTRMELASAQAAHALVAYMEDALLCLLDHRGGKEWRLRVGGERPGAKAGGQNTTE